MPDLPNERRNEGQGRARSSLASAEKSLPSNLPPLRGKTPFSYTSNTNGALINLASKC